MQSLVINFHLSFSRIADAEENLGESEVREAHLAKSLYYIQIGDKVHPFYSIVNLFTGFLCIFAVFPLTYLLMSQAKALDQLKVTESKTVAVGQKMDLVFNTLQLGFFYMDFDLISKSIDKAKK